MAVYLPLMVFSLMILAVAFFLMFWKFRHFRGLRLRADVACSTLEKLNRQNGKERIVFDKELQRDIKRMCPESNRHLRRSGAKAARERLRKRLVDESKMGRF